tara:strand:+ start:329 stop:1105 length:777 start_codon:yes stop_codon:yes gene_type:complete
MSLMNACILMLLLQPLFVYLALFKKSTGSGIKSVDNDDASYLFIAPGLSVFYIEQFPEALLFFTSICLLGLFLAKIVESKANKPLTKNDAIGFTISSFLFFGILKILIFTISTYFFADVMAENTASANQVEAASQQSVLEYFSIEFLYKQLWPSFYCLCGMLSCYLLSRLSATHFDIASLLLYPLAFLASFLPLFGDSYILCMFLNFFIYLFGCSLCVRSQSDPSSSGVAIVYGYIFMMGIGMSVFIKFIYEIIKLLS